MLSEATMRPPPPCISISAFIFIITFDIGGAQISASGAVMCNVTNLEGTRIQFRAGELFRKFDSVDGACSSWCRCDESHRIQCHKLRCIQRSPGCNAPDPSVNGGKRRSAKLTISFGEAIYIKNRGSCTCHESGNFICERMMRFPQLSQGLYILVGYSKNETEYIRENIPDYLQVDAGFERDSTAVAHDIKSQLQTYYARIAPTTTNCRIRLQSTEPNNVIFRMEVRRHQNNNSSLPKKWFSGGPEADCLPVLERLVERFHRGLAERYQVLLSAVKHLEVLDLLPKTVPDGAHCHLSCMLQLVTTVALGALLARCQVPLS